MLNRRGAFATMLALALLLPLVVCSQVGLSQATTLYVCNEGQSCALGAVINLTASATQTSDAIQIDSLSGMSFQVDHVGDAVGTLVLKASNDNASFYASQEASFAAIASTGGEIIELGNLRSRYYKLVYTHSSGTGPVKVTVHVKGRN